MKKYKKYKLREWNDLFIPTYGTNVYLVVYEDLKLLKKWCKKKRNFDLKVTGNPLGFVVPLEESDFVMCLRKGVYLDTITHECVHVRQFLFQDLGMYDGIQSSALMESEAYFTGSLFMEVYNRVRKYSKDDYYWINKPFNTKNNE